MHVYGGGYDATRILEQTQQGISGYDPEEPDMRGVFMARGPGNLDPICNVPKLVSRTSKNKERDEAIFLRLTYFYLSLYKIADSIIVHLNIKCVALVILFSS